MLVERTVCVNSELDAKDTEIAELKRQLAEARKDTERLDWLEAHPASAEPRSYWYYGWNWRWMGHMFNSIREAIDAAREGR